MIVRNSIRSVTRSPLKSVLFFLLIAVVSASLTLGVALFAMCRLMLDECGRSYYTTAVLEYRAGRYPERGVFDRYALGARSAVDFDALEKLDYVLETDRERTVTVSFPGLSRTTIDGTQAGRAVVIVVEVLWNNTLAKTKKVLFADSVREETVVPLYWSGEGEYPFVTGRTYIITGYTNGNAYGMIPVNVTSILNRPAREAGVEESPPFFDITGYGDISPEKHPELSFYYDAAESYSLISRSWYCKITPEPSFLEPFGEKEYAITEGHLYTREEAENTVCCVLPETIGLRSGLSVGDTVDIAVTSRESGDLQDSFWKTRDTGTETVRCLITGFSSAIDNSLPLVYISYIENSGDVGFAGYTLGTLRLSNGITYEQKKEIQSLVGDGVSVVFHDQGYASVTEALSKLGFSAATVTAIGAVACTAVLFLFAFLFIGRQREPIGTMFMMGTSKREIRLYVLTGSGLLLVISSFTGCSLSLLASDLLNLIISASMEGATSVLNLYSSGSLGVVKVISGSIRIPFRIAPAIFLAVTLTGIVFCLLFTRGITSGIGRKERRRTAAKVGREKKKAARNRTASVPRVEGAGRKYLYISIVRGGMRTYSVPLVCALMALFVLIPALALAHYRARLDELGKDTKITCFFTDYSGKARYDLVLPSTMTSVLENSEFFENFHYCQTDRYLVYATSGGYTYKDGMNVGKPTGETAQENMAVMPRIVYAEKLEYTPDFSSGQTASVEWLDGYGPSFFENESAMIKAVRERGYLHPGMIRYVGPDVRDRGLVISRQLSLKIKAGLGDSVDMLVSEDMIHETYTVVGIIDADWIGDTVFTRFENCILVLKSEGASYLRVRNTASCGYFELADTLKIREAKKWLRDTGFSRVHDSERYRLYPILEDAEYCDSAEKIEKNVGYLKTIIPAVSVLCLLAGAALSWLSMHKRREEIAALRSIGESAREIFRIFFTEQALLSVAGTLVTVAVFALATGLSAYYLFSPGFLAGYLIGSAFALKRMSRDDLVSVLCERE
ncbi:MAG: hypothetical protein ILO42_02795 [Clostridia bacterium]|nr:hypothetical protein [Clostridia bacterium]